MKNQISALKHAWKDLAISKKLYTVVGIMALLIASELFTLMFAMNILLAARAFVGGEGIWSKAQKDAVLEIKNYATTRDEHHYENYKKHIRIPIGDHNARLEMSKSEMDLSAVKAGFLAGQIHPDDIEPMVKLMRRFYRVGYIRSAIETWGKGDDMITQLMDLAERLHTVISSSPIENNNSEVNNLLNQISDVNYRLTDLESQFSSILGEASRWLENLLLMVLVLAVATIEGTGLLLTVSFSRGLSRDLKELQNFASDIGRGDLDKSVPVRSKDELGQLATALNKMAGDLRINIYEKQNAQQESKIKSLFLANMSHEIRTPLNSVLGFVELLKDPHLGEIDRKQYIQIIERTGSSLVTIINDILDLSKVEAGKLEVTKGVCLLGQIVSDLGALLELKCSEKGIALSFEMDGDIPNVIYTDSIRFKQILTNIIGNAIKFTSSGQVKIRFQVRGSQLICSVFDTGIGIAPENIERLFQPFSQVDPSMRKQYGGSGLGLTLSKRLAQLLGGDVWLEASQIDKGSCFVVAIMLEDKYLPENRLNLGKKKVAQEFHAHGLKGKKILLVDDSPDNQLLTKLFIDKAGALVDVANHGGEALDAISHKDFDLILMDLQMPVMDGYTATQMLRAQGNKTPIIALTGHAMKEDLDRCLELGCNAYLTKPIRREILIEKIVELI